MGPPGLKGDTGGGSLTAATVTLPAPAKVAHEVVVTDAAVSGTSKILIGWGVCADTDTNGPDMDPMQFAVRSRTAGSFVILVTSPQPITGPVNVYYQVA